ncbi:hypothetical protein ACQR1I_16640 [Bradyrhizobium sp. HKCCYLS2038]|uniref:hypothetical protein n=1 Tax=unclassified Bradyrhizobium TaxID=2631580 RepID=UPI003EB8E9F8
MSDRPETRALIADSAILALWDLGLNTFEIARLLRMRESDVANRLARLREPTR